MLAMLLFDVLPVVDPTSMIVWSSQLPSSLEPFLPLLRDVDPVVDYLDIIVEFTFMDVEIGTPCALWLR